MAHAMNDMGDVAASLIQFICAEGTFPKSLSKFYYQLLIYIPWYTSHYGEIIQIFGWQEKVGDESEGRKPNPHLDLHLPDTMKHKY